MRSHSSDLVPFCRPLAHGECCAWCFDARSVGRMRGETFVTHPCTFCGEFAEDFDGTLYGDGPGLRFGNPYMGTFGFYVRWREYRLQQSGLDLKLARLTDAQLIAEGGMRQRFPKALHFFDRYVKEGRFESAPYPDPVRFWILTNPDLSPRRLAAARGASA